jgi:uncharacterized membrane protein
VTEGDELPARSRHEEHAADLGRILAVSDGVFAIALTLLVLDFTIRSGLSDAEFRRRLVQLAPTGLAYLLTFATIARFWTVHRLVFRHLARVTGTLIGLNFAFLGLIAFLPFPTAVLGRYGDRLGGALFYAACLAAASLSSAALFWYASGPGRLLRHGVPRDWIRLRRIRTLVAPIVFLVSIPVAFLNVRVAEWLWAAVFVLPLVVRRIVGRRFETEGD